MILVETQAAGDEEAVAGFRLFQAVARLRREGKEGKEVRVGVMAPEEFKSDVRAADFIFGWGRWSDLDSLAQRLFAGLRWLDAQEATHIVCPLPAAPGNWTGIAGSPGEGSVAPCRLMGEGQGMLIAGLIEILDRCLVNEGADVAMAHLDGVDVIPLNRPFDPVSTFQHEDQVGLGLHLLLQIESFGMRAFRAPLPRRLLLVDQQRSIAPGIGPAPRAFGKDRPYKLPGA